MGQRGAVQAGAGEDAVVGFEDGGEFVRVEAFDADGEDADAVRGRPAGRSRSRPSMSATPSMKARTRSRSWAASFSTVWSRIHFDAFGQAGDADGVVAAGLVLVGHEVGLAVVLGDRSGAAFADRREDLFDARADVEEAGAERAEQAFVAGGGEQVDIVGLHVDGHDGRRIGRRRR